MSKQVETLRQRLERLATAPTRESYKALLRLHRLTALSPKAPVSAYVMGATARLECRHKDGHLLWDICVSLSGGKLRWLCGDINGKVVVDAANPKAKELIRKFVCRQHTVTTLTRRRRRLEKMRQRRQISDIVCCGPLGLNSETTPNQQKSFQRGLNFCRLAAR